jgi:hypothetical protein
MTLAGQITGLVHDVRVMLRAYAKTQKINFDETQTGWGKGEYKLVDEEAFEEAFGRAKDAKVAMSDASDNAWIYAQEFHSAAGGSVVDCSKTSDLHREAVLWAAACVQSAAAFRIAADEMLALITCARTCEPDDCIIPEPPKLKGQTQAQASRRRAGR